MIKGSDAFDFTTVEGKSDVKAGLTAKYSLRPGHSRNKERASLYNQNYLIFVATKVELTNLLLG